MTLEFIVQYTVKDGAEEEAQGVRDRFFSALRAQNGARYTYRSMAKPEKNQFVHLGRFEDEAALKEFQSLPEFPAFGEELSAVCSEGREALKITEIDTSVAG